MEMTGERLIPAPRGAVWEALNNPEILKAAIPGCSSLVKEGEAMTAVAAMKVGPVSAKFSGKVQLLDLDPPNGYRIEGEGQGGITGFAKGGARVRLTDRDDGTLLHYTAEVQIGGKIAQLGARLIDSTAKQMTNVFFDRFVAAIAPPEPAAVPVAAPPAVKQDDPVVVPPPAVPSPAPSPAAPVMAKETVQIAPQPASSPAIAGQWHGGSILLGVLIGAAIALIGVVVGHAF